MQTISAVYSIQATVSCSCNIYSKYMALWHITLSLSAPAPLHVTNKVSFILNFACPLFLHVLCACQESSALPPLPPHTYTGESLLYRCFFVEFVMHVFCSGAFINIFFFFSFYFLFCYDKKNIFNPSLTLLEFSLGG